MKRTNIKQGTIEWLNARHSRVGASEAYAIIRHFATNDELLAAGLQPEDVRTEVPGADEKPFQSAYAIWNRIVNGVELRTISMWDDLFGKAVETWVKAQFDKNKQPTSPVYMDKTNICSLDLCGGSGYPGIPVNGIGEVKSTRELLDEPKISWRVQNNIACRVTGNRDGYIFQVCLKDSSENMRSAVAMMYQKMPRKKFLEWFSGLEKKILIIPNPQDDRLLALLDTCLIRFWDCVQTKTPPIPVIDEEPNKASVGQLLGSYDDVGTYDMTAYREAKAKVKEFEDILAKEKQKIFKFCVDNKLSRVADKVGNATWSKSGALMLK